MYCAALINVKKIHARAANFYSGAATVGRDFEELSCELSSADVETVLHKHETHGARREQARGASIAVAEC